MQKFEPQPIFDRPMQVGECPLWHAEEAALYWIDIPASMIHRLHPRSGEHRQWELAAEPGCIARCADGGLVVAMRSGVALFDTDSGNLQTITDAPYDQSVARFNDGRCDAAGRLWVGTMYEPRDKVAGTLYCVEKGVIRDAGKAVTVSNGLGFSPDNRSMYHSDTSAHRISVYDFTLASGQLGESKTLAEFSRDKSAPGYGGRPDGATVDSEGAYWCAMFEGGRILRIAPSGEILQEIALPVRCPTMMAFGGEDLRTLYVTTAREKRSAAELAHYPLSGCVLALRLDVAGRLEPAYIT